MPDDPRVKRGANKGGAGDGGVRPVVAAASERPFVVEDDDEWESELAAWDAAIPIMTKGPGEPRRTPVADPSRPSGALPEAENSFFETPITKFAQAQPALAPDDVPAAIPSGEIEGGGGPASGSYAVLVTDESAASIFDHDPPPENPPSLPTDTLFEMAAAPWTEDIRRLICLGEAAPAQPERAYFETFAKIVAEERALEKDRERTVGLCLTAARVAEILGHPQEALAHVEAALAADVTPLASPASVAVHRARLGLAERGGRVDDEGAAESLARLALISHPDQTYYKALQAEWTLARAARGVVDGTAAALITTIPEGLARVLAEAEMAWREPIVGAAILATAATRLGGSGGAGFLALAAVLNEIAHDFESAAEQRSVAARLDENVQAVALGLVRDIARQAPDAALIALEELIPRFPPSPLKVALSRWGAGLARRVGDVERGWRFVVEGSRLGPLSAGLARDRLDLRRELGSESTAGTVAAGEIAQLLEPVTASWSAPVVDACLTLRACELAEDPEGVALALELVEQVVTDESVVVGLAPAVEALAERAGDRTTRLRALRLWRRIDPARELPALLDLADVLLGDLDPDRISATAPQPAEAVLGEIAALDPDSLAFWRYSALAAQRGSFSEAAARMDRGLRAAAWRDSALAGPLAEISAELLAREDVLGGLGLLEASRDKGDVSVAWRLTLGRLLRRLRDRDRFAAYAYAEIAEPGNREQRAALLLEPTFWQAETSGHRDTASLVFEALDMVALHPTALGVLLSARPAAAQLLDNLVAGVAGPGSQRWAVTAAVAASVSGDHRHALALALDAWRMASREGADTTVDFARTTVLLVRRSAGSSPPDERARIVSNLVTSESEADLVVEAAEGQERVGDVAAAAALFEQALSAPGSEWVAADARLGLARLSPPKLVAVGTSDGSGAASEEPLGALEAARRASRWGDVVARLIDKPPQADTPGARLLTLAAEIDGGQDAGRDPDKNVGKTEALIRAADPKATDVGAMGATLEGLAAETARANDHRSAALFLVEAAYLAEKAGDSGMNDEVERRLRAAVTHDPTSVPAVMAWRRWLTRLGRIDEAGEAAAAEAEALVDPELRVQTLLRAATLLTSVARKEPSPPALTGVGMLTVQNDKIRRSRDLLRRALEIAPHDHDAFMHLRDLYETAGEHAALADLLAVRIGATTNPFEVTALRLARAEIFAGPVGDRARAKTELEAILQKEPQHARALGRLADCEQEDGNDAAAAELLIRRASVERSPEKLRELFLRMGRIYTQRVPDPKRAVGAYGRVLQLDSNNREALEELSRLYVGLGETKSAVTLTERLVRIELDPARRADYHVRLGRLAERAGDTRAATVHFKRAFEESPTDIAAMGELVKHLDKTRDAAGRRLILDRAATGLRQAIIGDPDDRPALDALVAVSRWRGRTAVAAAAAELGTLLGGRSSGRTPILPDWAAPPAAGRRLTLLHDPSVDELTFPTTVPSSIRQLFRMLAPVLGESVRSELSRHRVDRGDRVAAGHAPRDIFDAIAAELQAGPFDIYVHAGDSQMGSVPLVVEPGKPPAIVIDASLIKLGSHAVRFMAGRTLRLIAMNLEGALTGTDADLGAWLGGIILQFVAEYRHPDVPVDVMTARAARVAKLIPKKLRQEVMPFALESSGDLDLGVLRMGIRDGANRVGLIASGSLGASLKVVLTALGENTGVILSTETLKRHPEAMTLLTFGLSDEYDDLVRKLE